MSRVALKRNLLYNDMHLCIAPTIDNDRSTVFPLCLVKQPGGGGAPIETKKKGKCQDWNRRGKKKTQDKGNEVREMWERGEQLKGE